MIATLLVAVLLAGAQTPSRDVTSATVLPETVACGPRAVFDKAEKTPPPITIGGTLADGVNSMYAPWHRLVVTAGSEQGVRVGQQYFVRRMADPYEDKKGLGLIAKERYPMAIVTDGWVRIDAVEDKRSIATIVHECGGIVPGDYLEPFDMPTVPSPLAEGTPDYGNPAEVLFGTERARVEGGGRLVVIDKGSKQGIQPGQRFTLFRASDAGPNVIVAKGIAVEVKADTSMIVINEIRDAVYAGDRAAPQR
jgi:hypothetical protein